MSSLPQIFMTLVHMQKDTTLSFSYVITLIFNIFQKTKTSVTKGDKGHQIYGESSNLKSGFKRNKKQYLTSKFAFKVFDDPWFDDL